MTVSSLSMSNSSRTVIQRLQLELAKAEKETGSMRHADVGLTLGGQTAATVSFRSQESSFKSQITSNKAVMSNLELMDDSLSTLSQSAEAMKSALTSTLAVKDSKTLGVAVEQAKSSLEQMAGALNISFGGQGLFGGANTDVPALTGGTGSKATQDQFKAFVTAATAATGSADSPSNVTKAQMEAYLGAGFTSGGTTYRFDALFSDAEWSKSWSDASDAQMTARISPSESITSSLSANDPAFRKLAASYSLIADLDIAGMSEEMRSLVVTKARTDIQAGIDGVIRLQTEIGFRLSRITSANEQLTVQMDTATKSYGSLEDVDPAEVALRVNNLLTQLQATAEVTGRIRALNILDYL